MGELLDAAGPEDSVWWNEEFRAGKRRRNGGVEVFYGTEERMHKPRIDGWMSIPHTERDYARLVGIERRFDRLKRTVRNKAKRMDTFKPNFEKYFNDFFSIVATETVIGP